MIQDIFRISWRISTVRRHSRSRTAMCLCYRGARSFAERRRDAPTVSEVFYLSIIAICSKSITASYFLPETPVFGETMPCSYEDPPTAGAQRYRSFSDMPMH